MKLRITLDGTVHSLWDDTVDWRALGPLSVRRASHVEFCDWRQMWFVRAGKPRNWARRILQRVLRRPCGEIVHWTRTRQQALAWERRYYEPGGPGWTTDKTSGNAD